VKAPDLADPMDASNMRVAAASIIKTLAHECGRQDITFNTIATGPSLTELSESYMTDAGSQAERAMIGRTAMSHWVRPDEMGGVVAFLCSTRASWITGETIRVDGDYGHSLF
jgi:3-oxoacyl-[acyl-carrier protein] reductase